jgi:hypothetical protein
MFYNTFKDLLNRAYFNNIIAPALLSPYDY